MRDAILLRPARHDDTDAIRAIALDTGMFTPDDIGDFDDILTGYLDESEDGHAWVVAERAGTDIIGAAYYAPEPFSDRVWNVYFIGVRPAGQRSGIGGAFGSTTVRVTTRSSGSR